MEVFGGGEMTILLQTKVTQYNVLHSFVTFLEKVTKNRKISYPAMLLCAHALPFAEAFVSPTKLPRQIFLSPRTLHPKI